MKQIDPGLIKRSRAGDSLAFRQIVTGYQSYAYSLAVRLLCHEEDAKDAVQEAFIRVWKHLDRYDSTIKFSTWLYKIVTHLCYDRLRTRKRMKTVSRFPDQPSDHPEKLYESRDLIARIRRLVHTLSAKQRLVFVLRDLQDQSVEDTARILNMSRSSVKSNLSLARKKIRERVEA